MDKQDDEKARLGTVIAPEGTPLDAADLAGSVEVLERLDKLERDQKHLAKLVDFVQGTNNLVIVVLFVGFLTLLVGFVTLVVEAIKGNSEKPQAVTTQLATPTPTTTTITAPQSSNSPK